MASPVTKDDTSSITAPTGATRATTDSAEGRPVSTFPSTQVYSTDKNIDKSTDASSPVLNAIPKIHSKDGVPRCTKLRSTTKADWLVTALCAFINSTQAENEYQIAHGYKKRTETVKLTPTMTSTTKSQDSKSGQGERQVGFGLTSRKTAGRDVESEGECLLVFQGES
ncbi:uncharacterized protein L203_106405 [Cryptococcus depauperatus CBS 7841]|uniref:Uncharacterized protein n=1 Tax=Cryptococcus depauperatus CBS 7841 TaxID=1295531 RepID=A0AAJ8JZ87_9TREE